VDRPVGSNRPPSTGVPHLHYETGSMADAVDSEENLARQAFGSARASRGMMGWDLN